MRTSIGVGWYQRCEKNEAFKTWLVIVKKFLDVYRYPKEKPSTFTQFKEIKQWKGETIVHYDAIVTEVMQNEVFFITILTNMIQTHVWIINPKKY